jgi:hypothetical protein
MEHEAAECCDDHASLDRMIGFITKQETLDEAVMLLMAAFNMDTRTIRSTDSADGNILQDVQNTTSSGGHWECAAARIIWMMPGIFEKEKKRANGGKTASQTVSKSTKLEVVLKVEPTHVLENLRCAHADETMALLIQKNSLGKYILSHDNKNECNTSLHHSDLVLPSLPQDSYQVWLHY